MDLLGEPDKTYVGSLEGFLYGCDAVTRVSNCLPGMYDGIMVLAEQEAATKPLL